MDSKRLEGHFLLLQINDSLFPIGAYSHSYGLETYIQRGLVHNGATAATYIRNRLRFNFLYTDLLAARLAYDGAVAGDVKYIDHLEDMMEASRLPMELREASKKLGNRFCKTLFHMEGPWHEDFFRTYMDERKGKTTCHPCAYGVFCASQGIEKDEALANYLYAQASAMITNCVKTVPLSQSEGQKILNSLHPVFKELLQHVETVGEEMLCASTPGFDLRSMEHEHLYSRLYMS